MRRCRIDNQNLKTWSRVIHVLTSLGDEDIHFSFTDSTLTLTVFDSSLAVSVTCTFFASFFQAFSFPHGYAKTFKVSTKCFLKPFRSMRFLTKSCTTCEITFEDASDTILVTMGCKSGAEIRYTIGLSEELVEMHTDYDPDSLTNWIRTEPKTLITSLHNFAHSKGLIDLTLKAEGNKILLKNCANDLMRKEGKIYTELLLSALEFDRINIEVDTEVTFQMRDFKTFITFAEHMKLPIGVHFQGVKDPVILTVKSEHFEITLLMATKFVADVADLASAATSQSSVASSSNGRISNVSSHDGTTGTARKASLNVNGATTNTSAIRPRTGDEDAPASFDFPMVEDNRVATPPNAVAAGRLTSSVLLPRISEREAQFIHSPTAVSVCIQDEVENVANRPPPRKKLRELFNCVDEVEDIAKRFPGHDRVLVGDSDEED